jgi:hypothetical protein
MRFSIIECLIEKNQDDSIAKHCKTCKVTHI